MSTIFAPLVLISLSALLLAVPRASHPLPRTLSENREKMLPLLRAARNIAEGIIAPLSIVFGSGSLYYARRAYVVGKARAEARRPATGPEAI